MAVATALELLWPLVGNGPIFSRVSNFVLNKCTKHWWRNLLFINNYGIDTIDIVSVFDLFRSFSRIYFVLFTKVRGFVLLLECGHATFLHRTHHNLPPRLEGQSGLWHVCPINFGVFCPHFIQRN